MADTSTQNNTIEINVPETNAVSKAVLAYWNAWADKPAAVQFQFLPAYGPAMALAQSQGVHTLKRSITGKITSQYLYRLFYRSTPQTSADRLDVDAVLMAAVSHAETDSIDIGDGRTVTKHEAQSTPIQYAWLENGSEDWAVDFILEYTHYNK